MNARMDRLSQEIWDFYLDNKQTADVFTRKVRLRGVLYEILQKRFSDEYYVRLYVVGSSVNGLGSNSCDAECVWYLSLKDPLQATQTTY